MSPYAVALFAHIVGVILLFVGVGVLVLATIAIRRTRRAEDVRALIVPLTAGRRIGLEHISVVDAVVVAGVLLIALSALYMVPTAWSLEVPWIRVAIAATVIAGLLGPFVVNPRLHRIAHDSRATPDGPLAGPLAQIVRDRVLTMALGAMASTLLGVVFLMTDKPPAFQSVAAVAIAAALGIVFGVLGF